VNEQAPAAGSPRPGRGRAMAFQLTAVGLVVVCAIAGTGLARLLRGPKEATEEKREVTFPGRALKGWTKPDFVLVLSGQMMGYLQPCGCSRPQVGGLDRRYNLLRHIKGAEWPVVAVDLGDLGQKTGPAGLANVQGPIKYGYALKALKLMDYAAVGIGETEALLGLGHLLDNYVFDQKVPSVITSNLMGAEKNFPTMTAPWVVSEVQPAGVKVGVAHIVGPTVTARVGQLKDDKVQFGDPAASLDNVVKAMKEKKVDLPLLLYQGPQTRDPKAVKKTEALAVAEKYPQFPLIVCLSDDDEGSLRPTTVTTEAKTTSHILTVGRRGKYVGVVGVWKTGKEKEPFAFKYERVELSEDFMTPRDQAKDHPVIKLWEEYTRELKAQDYLAKHKQVSHEVQLMPEVKDLLKPGEAKYVGSAKCKKCHEEAYEVWKKSAHSHAYKTLVEKADPPSNRQYDPECIVCHTVGFGVVSGYVSEAKTPRLKDVGCESCHGPASLHVANSGNKDWKRRINPWKYLPPEKRAFATDQFCQKCHDEDNDVTWKNGAFEKKWALIAHPNPPKKKD
jgi:Cytochrome c554 and c-prime